MLRRKFLALALTGLAALAVAALPAEARGRRGCRGGGCGSGSCGTACGGGGGSYSPCGSVGYAPAPQAPMAAAPQAEGVTVAALGGPVGAADAMGEVNAARAQRGLPPFERDEGLMAAAQAAADFRAARGIEGHTRNDFAFLPPGAHATAAGCAAWEPSWGFGSCCMYERWRVAGAAWAWGRDGRRYCHLFVR
jgi:hypothetical protein